MANARIGEAVPISSYLIECLVWNVPDDHFGLPSYKAEVREALAFLWNNTRDDSECQKWGEINELKYLFRPSQPWTRRQVNDFLHAAWDYIGYE